MLDRRSILAGAAIAAAATTQKAEAASQDVKYDPNNLSDKMKKLHSARFPTQDKEGIMDFLEGFKRWNDSDVASKAQSDGRDAFLKAKNMNPADTGLGYEQSFQTLLRYPTYAAQLRLQWAAQDIMWDHAFREFHQHRDHYLAMLEETDKAGPGTLELNPEMHIPEYTAHEIHRQPGGYVGDPFAGYAYHWALTQAYYRGRSEHDETHIAVAQSHPTPADGEVNRVLEIGCSSGMTTVAYKERFPDAEVWGIDIGGPMVRYAHHRAVKMGIPVNFAQRLAEDSKFPDNHFCMVTDYLLFHEVSREAAEKIVKEMYRVMRPGGVWKHNDIPTEGNPKVPLNKTIWGKAATWNSSRHNYEPWWVQWVSTDFPGLLRKAGFTVDLDSPNGGSRWVVATKPA